jgi:hypothetical protein
MPEIKNQAEYRVAGSCPFSGLASPLSRYLLTQDPVCDTIHRNVNHLLLSFRQYGFRDGRNEAPEVRSRPSLAYFSATKATSWATTALPPGVENKFGRAPKPMKRSRKWKLVCRNVGMETGTIGSDLTQNGVKHKDGVRQLVRCIVWRLCVGRRGNYGGT